MQIILTRPSSPGLRTLKRLVPKLCLLKPLMWWEHSIPSTVLYLNNHFRIPNEKKWNVLKDVFKRSFGFFLIGPCRVQREAHSFQPQMKLEAVDKRSPGLIRVATVEEVDTHRIKVSSVPPSFLFLFSELMSWSQRSLGERREHTDGSPVFHFLT